MKMLLVLLSLTVAWLLVYGTPFASAHPEKDNYYGSPEAILPMTFAHSDHTDTRCMDCHHNFVDDTGGEPCMHCHVSDASISELLEPQFHDFCRGCHEREVAAGQDSGPVRRCIACHLTDSSP